MSKVAFELRADASDFSGGTVSLPGGDVYDVGAALKDGGGKITLDPDAGSRKGESAQTSENERASRESRIAEALRNFPALKTAATRTTSEGGDS